MPHRVNGCGTWYYGRTSAQQYEGHCEACGRQAILSSYDTRLFVSILFIPVIPLSRKRVIEQCSACQRHRVMSLADYHSAQGRLAQTMDAFRRAPGNAELAREAMQACAAFRNLPAFLEVAPELEAGMARDAKTLCLIASLYDLFGRLEDALRVLGAARAVNDEPDVRELMGSVLMRLGRPDEAEAYLRHIVDQGIPDRVDLLYHLAQGFQAKGQHDKALEVFQQCVEVNPRIGDDPTFQKLRGASEKRRGKNQPLKPGAIGREVAAAQSRKRGLKFAALIVVLAAVAYAVTSVILGYNRQVYLLNGLERPYTIEFNGQRYTLAPMRQTPVRIAEGEFHVQIVDPPSLLPAETVSVRSSFWTRPFSKNVFIINPDGVAIVNHARVYYSSGAGRKPDNNFVGGQTLMHFNDVDHSFEKPPESVSVDSASGQASRVVVDLVNPAKQQMSSVSVLVALTDRLGAQNCANIARHRVLLEPERPEYVSLLLRWSGPQQTVDFLRPLLKARPVRVQWHRSYQSAMGLLGKDEQVEQEYADMLAREPKNTDLMYLTGRASHDVDRGVALCLQAIEGSPPSAYAYYYLAGHALEDGDFKGALAYGRRAMELMPGQNEAKSLYIHAMIADRQYSQALELLRPDEALPTPDCMLAFNEEIYIYAVTDKRDEVDQAINRLSQRLKLLPGTATEFDSQQRALASYTSGDFVAFLKAMDASKDPDDRFMACITRGDVAGAEEQSAKFDAEAEWHLVLFISARVNHAEDVAERHRQAAIDLLSKGDYSDRAYAAAFKGDPSMPAAKVVRVWRGYETKRIYLAALGLHDPVNREVYFAAGRKLNFNRRFPYLLIDQVFAPPTPGR